MLNQWRYSLGWSFTAYEKIEFCAIYLLPAIALQMIWSLLALPIGRWLRAYQLSFVVCAVVIVMVPGLDIHYHTLRPWQMWSIPLLVALPLTVIRQARAGNVEAGTALVGVLIFAAACTNDLVIDLAGWEGTRLVPLGFAAIMLFMAISLANRFTTTFNNLEGEVAQRTSELISANRLLADSARMDPLTGVLNRRGLSEMAEVEIQRFSRSGQTFSVALADLDNFKKFNDQHGHACGDYVLQKTADLLRDGVRNIDKVCRWGGEEFMLVLPETDADGAVLLVEKLRASLEAARFEYQENYLGITLTCGIAVFRSDETLESCIARADRALYQGKEQGRNRVIVDSSGG
jgi:diguanylate cyclase (GGDEF)-like protein